MSSRSPKVVICLHAGLDQPEAIGIYVCKETYIYILRYIYIHNIPPRLEFNELTPDATNPAETVWGLGW